jgi:hypothetical protein
VKNLFELSSATEIMGRIERLRPDSEREWGLMNVAQMLAHCSAWKEMAAGVSNPPRNFLGRIVGKMAKKSILDKPIRRDMPPDKSLKIEGERNFAVEQQRLLDWVERFSSGGPDQCTRHPHSFRPLAIVPPWYKAYRK